ncbi:MAG: chitobiase/beta-hexosaminidase C-terminal domain-containing protein [Deltaproteobacteria bacterium]|nr:chitobiase/beta-hexosaminidase C-terminal domain-containing protein [Deltaproteobacteria bacterium]
MMKRKHIGLIVFLSLFFLCRFINIPFIGSSPVSAATTEKTKVQVATPIFTPAGGTYTSHPNVVISCKTTGAIIRYTTYGGEPTAASPQYTGPIPVIITTTLKAKAFKWDMADSNTAVATYAIGGNPSTVATPAFSPAGGTYASPQNVSLSCGTVGATIRYTTNGSEPTVASMLYSTPIPVNATATLKAKAFKSGLTETRLVRLSAIRPTAVNRLPRRRNTSAQSR